MAHTFIPYTPDVEVIEPDFDQNLQTVIEKTESYIAESVTAEGTGRAVRDAHAKGYGLVRGEVEILGRLSLRVRARHLCHTGKARRAYPLLQWFAPRRGRRAARRSDRIGAEDLRYRRSDPPGG